MAFVSYNGKWLGQGGNGITYLKQIQTNTTSESVTVTRKHVSHFWAAMPGIVFHRLLSVTRLPPMFTVFNGPDISEWKTLVGIDLAQII